MQSCGLDVQARALTRRMTDAWSTASRRVGRPRGSRRGTAGRGRRPRRRRHGRRDERVEGRRGWASTSRRRRSTAAYGRAELRLAAPPVAVERVRSRSASAAASVTAAGASVISRRAEAERRGRCGRRRDRRRSCRRPRRARGTASRMPLTATGTPRSKVSSTVGRAAPAGDAGCASAMRRGHRRPALRIGAGEHGHRAAPQVRVDRGAARRRGRRRGVHGDDREVGRQVREQPRRSAAPVGARWRRARRAWRLPSARCPRGAATIGRASAVGATRTRRRSRPRAGPAAGPRRRSASRASTTCARARRRCAPRAAPARGPRPDRGRA